MNKLEVEIEKFKEDSKMVKKFISDFLTKDLNKQKTIELYHLGKFLYSLDEESKIESISESPDFLVRINNKLCGIELVNIFKKDNVEKEKFKHKIIEFAEDIFAYKYPEIKILANIYFSKENLNISKNEIPTLAEKIADNIYYFFNGQIEYFDFNLLDKPLIFKHNILSFSYNPGGFMVNPLTISIVEEVITKKENKINNYLNKMVEEIWLLIIVSHSQSESYEIFEEDEHIFTNFNSKFDKVYILEDFKLKNYRLK